VSTERAAPFGNAVRKARRDRELSQEAFAPRAGLAPKHLSEIERGRRDARLTTVAAIVDAFDFTDAARARFWEEAVPRHALRNAEARHQSASR